MRRQRQILFGAAAVLVAVAVAAVLLLAPGARELEASAPTPAPTATPAPTPAPTEVPLALARIRAAGDIIIDAPMLEPAYSGGAYKFGKYFALSADELADADLTVVNVEGAMAGQGALGYTGYPSFNTPPSILGALKACGVDMLTLANNHALDRYYDGLMNTLRNVDKAGLQRTGAYRSQNEHDAPLVVDVNGIQIGITNYTTGLNGVEKRSDKRAVEFGVRIAQKSDFRADIQALRDAGAQAVVVFMHWDREYKRMPSEATRKYAQTLAEAGADVIIGGHPHMVQPVEWIETSGGARALCLFSMGNFLSNHKGEYLDNGIIFEVSFALRADGRVHIVDPKYIPVWVWVQKAGGLNYQVVPVSKMLAARPEEMTDEQFARLVAAWDESVEILGTDIAQPE